MKTLVIVESHTKAKTISKFLGKNYKVLSSFGHVRDLPKSKIGVDIEHGFEPQYVVSKDKAKVVKELKDAAKKADHILFATDEDREGEAISFHLAHILDIKPEEADRITFHEITKSAIEHAIQNPRHLDLKSFNFLRSLESFVARIETARSPAFFAPFTATVATGTPGGI
jgi:DNA topoisomerase-1